MKKLLCLIAALLPVACAVAQENPIANASQLPGFCSIIHRWGFVGDLLCSGEHEYYRDRHQPGGLDVHDLHQLDYRAQYGGLL